jgi:hypothetical protein
VLDHFGVAICAQIVPSAANQEKTVEAVPAISVFRPFVVAGGLVRNVPLSLSGRADELIE